LSKTALYTILASYGCCVTIANQPNFVMPESSKEKARMYLKTANNDSNKMIKIMIFIGQPHKTLFFFQTCISPSVKVATFYSKMLQYVFNHKLVLVPSSQFLHCNESLKSLDCMSWL